MLIIGQLYYLLPSGDNLENAAPAQFVYTNNNDNTVRGFISEVTLDRLTICLWEPSVLPEDAVVLANKLDPDTVYELLQQALKENPAMRKPWVEALSNSTASH